MAFGLNRIARICRCIRIRLRDAYSSNFNLLPFRREVGIGADVGVGELGNKYQEGPDYRKDRNGPCMPHPH